MKLIDKHKLIGRLSRALPGEWIEYNNSAERDYMLKWYDEHLITLQGRDINPTTEPQARA